MRHFTTRLIVAAWAVVTAACAAPRADTLLVNGRIFTANPAQPWVEALAIRGERIVAAGTTAALAVDAGGATRRIDLGGRTVVPGFNDAHLTLPDPSPESARLIGAEAAAAGVTSIQVFSAGPIAATVRALIDAHLPLRVRVLRMPQPDPSGANRDSRPFFPPQPGPRIDARGMGFIFGAADETRLRQAVGWAYGSEDPLAIHSRDPQALESYVAALEAGGTAEVWKAKRPRIEHPASVTPDMLARLTRLGVVVVQNGGDGPLKSIVAASVPLALGSGEAARGLALVRSATMGSRGVEALTREEAVTGYTRGSAFAEFAERDKGQLLVGMFADLAVLSADIFTVPSEHVNAIRSILTMVGGRAIHDTGALR